LISCHPPYLLCGLTLEKNEEVWATTCNLGERNQCSPRLLYYVPISLIYV
jgi:hypothetical protein